MGRPENTMRRELKTEINDMRRTQKELREVATDRRA